MFLTLPFMAAIQIISASIGWQTRRGLARNLAQQMPAPVLYGLVALLVVANTINIAADLAAMAQALSFVMGGPVLIYAAGSASGACSPRCLSPTTATPAISNS